MTGFSRSQETAQRSPAANSRASRRLRAARRVRPPVREDRAPGQAVACRLPQLASRARRNIDAEAASARFKIDPEEQRRAVDTFIAACARGQLRALLPLLDPSVIGRADLGGTLAAVSQPNVGREQVAQQLMGFFGAASGTTMTAREINGESGIIAFRGGDVSAVLALSVRDGLVTRLYAMADPRKLVQVRRERETQG